jgi:hypothetical protein
MGFVAMLDVLLSNYPKLYVRIYVMATCVGDKICSRIFRSPTELLRALH